MRRTARTVALLGVAALAVPAAAFATDPTSTAPRDVFLSSVREDTTLDQATLPVYTGYSHQKPVSFVVTESSSRWWAKRLGVNYSPKLANARGTAAVEKVSFRRGRVVFPATVDFSPTRTVVPSATGFPPTAATPGQVGEAGYSPLVQLPDGTVVNAPQVANDSGQHDKLVSFDEKRRRASFRETEGFYEGKTVYYVSFDSSAPDIAALEAATYAPALNAAPGLGSNDPKTSARSGIIPFVNGQTGIDNPERQGLNSALLDGADPLNIVQTLPDDGEYSPLWDVHATQWTPATTAAGQNLHQTDFDAVRGLADSGTITGPGGGKWGAIGVIVNCPLISLEK
jgi:hypothetical protein